MNIAKIYPYVDEKGKLLFEVVRLEPKDFKQRRKIQGLNEYVWSLGAGAYHRREDGVWHPVMDRQGPETNFRRLEEARRVLYGLDRLTEKPNDPLIVCEGEKDVERLWGLGFLATCNPGGCGKWKTEYSSVFHGRRVAVIADNDAQGLDHAMGIIGQAMAFGCESVRLVREFGAKDISDWLDLNPKFNTHRQEVIDLIRSYREWK